jgi:predicted amidohydrolase
MELLTYSRSSRLCGREDPGEKQALSVGVLQFAPQSRSLAENVEFIKAHVRKLSDALVVLPEFFLGSYIHHPLFFIHERELATVLRPLLKVSSERNVSLVGSLPIDSGAHPYNRAILIHAGEIRPIYDKQLLFGDEQSRFRLGGAGSRVFSVNGVRCSVRICMDIVDPLATQGEEESDVQLILGPAAVSVDFLRIIHKARSLENQALSLFCNRSGEEPWERTQYLGRSGIFFPDGSEQGLDAPAEAIKIVELRKADLDAIDLKRRDFMAIRSTRTFNEAESARSAFRR